MLTTRLKSLVDAGLLARLYQERPERYEYRLTEKGIDLWPVLFTLMKFGDKHAVEGDLAAPLVTHRECGTLIDDTCVVPPAACRWGRGMWWRGGVRTKAPPLLHRKPLGWIADCGQPQSAATP